MSTSTKFNVYYATSPNGPWELANDTPIDRASAGNQYTFSGLNENTEYYVSIVGGEVTNNTFASYISQPIGPKQEGAVDVTGYPPTLVKVKTFTPVKSGSDNLSHQFEVV